MSDEQVPEDVREFIARHIDSVGQLEALLLLRTSPDERWKLSTVARRLYTGERESRELLTRLCDDGLVSCSDDTYWFAASEAQRAVVDQVAAVYSSRLIAVTNLIHGKTRRIREFARAFRLRKDS